MFFLYVDEIDYEMTEEGIFQMCYDEVVAEAKDTGDFPMYGEALLRQSAEWKVEEFLQHCEDYRMAHEASLLWDSFVREQQCGGGLPPLYKIAWYH